MKYLSPIRPKLVPKLDLLKFGTFDISNIPILILLSKVFFIKIFLSNINFYQITINSEHFSIWDEFGPSSW